MCHSPSDAAPVSSETHDPFIHALGRSSFIPWIPIFRDGERGRPKTVARFQCVTLGSQLFLERFELSMNSLEKTEIVLNQTASNLISMNTPRMAEWPEYCCLHFLMFLVQTLKVWGKGVVISFQEPKVVKGERKNTRIFLYHSLSFQYLHMDTNSVSPRLKTRKIKTAILCVLLLLHDLIS